MWAALFAENPFRMAVLQIIRIFNKANPGNSAGVTPCHSRARNNAELNQPFVEPARWTSTVTWDKSANLASLCL
jgi:hypothetical protein